MGRRKRGKYPYDYTAGDDRRFVDSGVGGTLRVLHGPGRGMGITEGVTCRVEVLGADGALLDEAWAGKLGKEHRLRGTVPGDTVDVTVTAHYEPDEGSELTATRTVVLTGDLEDVVRFGVGPGWDQVAGLDAGELPWQPTTPTSSCWGAGVRLRGARLTTAEDDDLDALAEHVVRTPLDDLDRLARPGADPRAGAPASLPGHRRGHRRSHTSLR